jgi:hypothetical protein
MTIRSTLVASIVVTLIALTETVVSAQDRPESIVADEDTARLQAKIHRLMADLIEAKAAEETNKRKIAALTDELESVRAKLRKSNASGSPQPPKQVDQSVTGARGRGHRFRGGQGPGRAGGPGRGWGWGRGAGGGGGADSAFEKDRDLFHLLLDNRQSIKRTVKKTNDGVETVTESNDPKITAAIQQHVASMKQRVEKGNPIHMRDPLFATVFSHADKISMKVVKTESGVRVVETSPDPYVVRLIQAHAEVVNLFVANGRDEARKNHAVPAR